MHKKYNRAYYENRHKFLNSEKGKNMREKYIDYFVDKTSSTLNTTGNLRDLDYTMVREIRMLEQGKLTGFKI